MIAAMIVLSIPKLLVRVSNADIVPGMVNHKLVCIYFGYGIR